MEVKTVKLVSFSPTGTTRKVLKGVAKGYSKERPKRIDLTLLDGSEDPISFASDELMIIGAPVYAGRIPVDAVERFKRLKGDNTPAVLVVLYGNRHYDDALLELKNLVVELGFKPVAACAFIGEHSFETKEYPVAPGRPDKPDVKLAQEFGGKVQELVSGMASADIDLEVPGNFPYKDGIAGNGIAPVTTEDKCSSCGNCVEACPTGALTMKMNQLITDAELCIRCGACIKFCMSGARYWDDSNIKDIIVRLHENCSERREPEFFGVA